MDNNNKDKNMENKENKEKFICLVINNSGVFFLLKHNIFKNKDELNIHIYQKLREFIGF